MSTLEISFCTHVAEDIPHRSSRPDGRCQYQAPRSNGGPKSMLCSTMTTAIPRVCGADYPLKMKSSDSVRPTLVHRAAPAGSPARLSLVDQFVLADTQRAHGLVRCSRSNASVNQCRNTRPLSRSNSA